jgi:hypothetical protein
MMSAPPPHSSKQKVYCGTEDPRVEDTFHAVAITDLPQLDFQAAGCGHPAGVIERDDVVVAAVKKNGGRARRQAVVAGQLGPGAGDEDTWPRPGVFMEQLHEHGTAER